MNLFLTSCKFRHRPDNYRKKAVEPRAEPREESEPEHLGRSGWSRHQSGFHYKMQNTIQHIRMANITIPFANEVVGALETRFWAGWRAGLPSYIYFN